MGNSNKKKKTEISSKIGHEFTCPLCSKLFDANTTFNILNAHVIECAQNNRNSIGVLQPSEVDDNVYSIRSREEDLENHFENNLIEEKLHSTRENTNISKKIGDQRPFEIKIQELKTRLLAMKVDWRDAHCTMELNREYVLKDSMTKYEKLDPYKELKINFKGEVSYDAGGIIREWFTVLIKELQSPELYTTEFSYIIKKNLTPSNKNLEYFNFIGKLMAKALLENITLNLCFNKLIYKIILNEPIKFEDLIFIDRPMYNSLKELKKTENIEDLFLFYVVEYRDHKGNLITDELKKNGANELVKDINDYIKKRIDYTVMKNKLFVNEIKNALFKVIPENYIACFNSDEFELILNGRPFIDVEEWKTNTIYQGKYSQKHKVIKWFWDVMFSLSQEELSKFLQFCTGCSRVPLGGFSVLESNRGEISKFCIVPVNFNSKGINYIKAHTCFNRIDLPCFTNDKQVKDAINYIINNEILGFGID